MKLFVGNFPFEVTEEDLRKAFEPFGEVFSVTVMKERNSDESRGFGFVEMLSKREALAAMQALDGQEWMGRTLKVNEARPRPQFHQDNWRKGGGRKGGQRRRDSRRRNKGGSRKRRSGWGY
ncbi:MAG: RNA recognition motif domain-containing protein [Candidatus Zixiibacteriota bacterium]